MSGPTRVFALNPICTSVSLLDDKPTDLPTRIERWGRALKPSELAELLGVSAKQIYSLTKRGRIPAIRIASSVRLDPFTTAKWLRSLTA